MAERLNAPLSKSGIPEKGSQVQILYPPQSIQVFNYARLAQLVERVIDVDDVRGSNPLSRTKYGNTLCEPEHDGARQGRKNFQ